jgi:hypothetical protein
MSKQAPKSSRRTRSPWPSTMLSGFTSRWITPASCAACRMPARSIASGRAPGAARPCPAGARRRATLHDLHREERLGLRAALEQDRHPGVFDRGERPPLAAEPVLQVVMPAQRGRIVLSAMRRRFTVSNATCTRPMPPSPSSPHEDVAPREPGASRFRSAFVGGGARRPGRRSAGARLRVAGRLDVGLAQGRVRASIDVISARKAAVITFAKPPGCGRGRGRRRGSGPRPSAAPPATARARRRRAAGPRRRSSRAPCRGRRRRGSLAAHPAGAPSARSDPRASLAMPKSMTLANTSPPGCRTSMMFEGFTSRWITPAAWA